jgi:glycosyltransferase involved in cell wall biosynthesis
MMESNSVGSRSPVVSVILPTFNRPDETRLAIDSVLAQTMVDYELIIVDDGSTIAIEAALSDLTDNRIKLIKLRVNCGAAAARNIGIQRARGQFIAFLDSDDRWLPDKMELQIVFMNESLPQPANISCTGFFYHKPGWRRWSRVVPSASAGEPRAFLDGCFISPGSTMMVRRTFLEKVGPQNESLERFEDWEWLLRATRYTGVPIVSKPLAIVIRGGEPDLKLVRRAGRILARCQASNILDQYGKQGLAVFRSSVNVEIAVAAFKAGNVGIFAIYGIWAFLHSPWRVLRFVTANTRPRFFVKASTDNALLMKNPNLPVPSPDPVASTKTVLVVIGSLDIGGTERHLLTILPRLRGGRINPVLFLLEKRGTLAGEMERRGVRIIEPWIATKSTSDSYVRAVARLLVVSVQLFLYLAFRRPAIVHFFLPASYLIGAPLAILAGIRRRVLSRRSLNIYQTKRPVLRKIEHLLHRRMKCILGNSVKVVAELIHSEHAPIERTGLLYNGVVLPPAPTPDLRRAVRVRLGVDEDALVLTIIANLILYKGHNDLVEALGLVGDELPAHWRLLVVGRDDGIGPDLIDAVTQRSLNENVLFLGNRGDVEELLVASDIGLLVSHQEGFSNAILEGMALGLPMVVTDVGGNAEAVIERQTGLVVPARDPEALGKAILELALSPNLRATMGRAGRVRAENYFSIGRCVEQYESIYGNILGGGTVADLAGISAQDHGFS